jgi:hypothetical protein
MKEASLGLLGLYLLAVKKVGRDREIFFYINRIS